MLIPLIFNNDYFSTIIVVILMYSYNTEGRFFFLYIFAGRSCVQIPLTVGESISRVYHRLYALRNPYTSWRYTFRIYESIYDRSWFYNKYIILFELLWKNKTFSLGNSIHSLRQKSINPFRINVYNNIMRRWKRLAYIKCQLLLLNRFYSGNNVV